MNPSPRHPGSKAVILLLTALFLAIPGTGFPAENLRIAHSRTNVVLAWPTNALGYQLRFTDSLSPNAQWELVTTRPALGESNFFVIVDIIGAGRFYRLGSAPTLSDINVSLPTVPFGRTREITFSSSDLENDIASAEVTISNALGVSLARIPAKWWGLTQTGGVVNLPLSPDKLVYGQNTFDIRLLDRDGGASEARSFSIQLVGDGGTGSPPNVIEFIPESSTFTRPVGLLDRFSPSFSCSFADLDGDIERVRIRHLFPDGFNQTSEYQAAAFGIIGAQAFLQIPAIAFRSTNQLGNYTIEITLIDRTGNLSVPVSANIALVASGGLEPLRISDINPKQGTNGTEVTLTATGFDVSDPNANQVRLGGLEAELVEVGFSTRRCLSRQTPGPGSFQLVTNGELRMPTLISPCLHP